MTSMEEMCFCCTMIVLAFFVFLLVRRSPNGVRKQASLTDRPAGLEEAGRAVNPMVRNSGQKASPVASRQRVNPMVRGAAENREKE